MNTNLKLQEAKQFLSNAERFLTAGQTIIISISNCPSEDVKAIAEKEGSKLYAPGDLFANKFNTTFRFEDHVITVESIDYEVKKTYSEV